MGRRIRAILTLYRWDSSLALAVLFLAAFPKPVPADAFLGAIAWFFAAAGAYALNDAVDIDIDRVNHAARPLPAGAMSVGDAKRASGIAFGVAIGVAAMRPPLLAWIIPSPLVAIVFCTVVRPRSSLASNAMASAGVACIAASAAAVGGSLASERAVLVAALAFTVMLARELQMDLRDAPGDGLLRPAAVLLDINRRGASLLYRVILSASLVLLVSLARSRQMPPAAWAFLLVGALPLIALVFRDPFAASDRHAQLLKLAGCGAMGVLVSST